MAKKKGQRKTTKARTLPVGESSKVKGGSLLQSSFSNVIKSIGEGLSAMARKG